VQHVDSVIELRHIQHSERSCGISNPNFPHPSADRIHGLPVVGLAPMLDLVELISRLAPGRLRKRAQILQCATSELDGLRIEPLDWLYKILYIMASFARRYVSLAERQNQRNIAVPVAVLHGCDPDSRAVPGKVEISENNRVIGSSC
jgi:hypothetical protein